MGWNGTDPAQWAQELKEKLERAHQEAVAQLAREMTKGVKSGGLVPEDTGNLVNSVAVSTGPISVAAPDTKFSKPDLSQVQNLKLEDKVYLGWRAPYTHGLNYGRTSKNPDGKDFNDSGKGFAEGIAANWQDIVDAAVRKVRDE